MTLHNKNWVTFITPRDCKLWLWQTFALRTSADLWKIGRSLRDSLLYTVAHSTYVKNSNWIIIRQAIKWSWLPATETWNIPSSLLIHRQRKQVLVNLENVIKFFLSLQLVQFDKDAARVESKCEIIFNSRTLFHNLTDDLEQITLIFLSKIPKWNN